MSNKCFKWSLSGNAKFQMRYVKILCLIIKPGQCLVTSQKSKVHQIQTYRNIGAQNVLSSCGQVLKNTVLSAVCFTMTFLLPIVFENLYAILKKLMA